eukprot:9544218-Ditylum_brightwellii.AAC.1
MHRNDSSNTNSAIGYTLDRPISPLHQCDRSCTSDQHQISRAPEHGMISETRNRCRPRSSYRSHRFNSHLFPRCKEDKSEDKGVVKAVHWEKSVNE